MNSVPCVYMSLEKQYFILLEECNHNRHSVQCKKHRMYIVLTTDHSTYYVNVTSVLYPGHFWSGQSCKILPRFVRYLLGEYIIVA